MNLHYVVTQNMVRMYGVKWAFAKENNQICDRYRSNQMP